MNRLLARLATLLAVLALTHAGQARADFMDWSWSWSGTSSDPTATTSNGSLTISRGSGSVIFVPQSGTSGASDILAGAFTTSSQASANSPDAYNNVPFTLTLTLKDNTNSQSNTVSFNGKITGPNGVGNIWSGGTNAQLVFDPTMLSQTVPVGTNNYKVTLDLPTDGTLNLPGGPQKLYDAFVSVTPAGSVAQVPEPSSLLLGGLASVLGLGWWRRRNVSAVTAA
jgi:hypothetical protein